MFNEKISSIFKRENGYWEHSASSLCFLQIKKLKLREVNDLLAVTQPGRGGAWILCPWPLWSRWAPKIYSADFLRGEEDCGYVHNPLYRPQEHPVPRSCQPGSLVPASPGSLSGPRSITPAPTMPWA